MLPTVDFCGLKLTRLLIGANPFGGYSHQTPARSEEMKNYYTVERILETWERAAAAGINTFVTNNETPHVLEAVEKYFANGGKMQWIAQVSKGTPDGNLLERIDQAVERGASAIYIHGGVVDGMFEDGLEDDLRAAISQIQKHGIPAGVAGHCPDAHKWVDRLDIVDFHTVCFFNCGSVHRSAGDKFMLRDLGPSTDFIKQVKKPCIGYKIMAAGRIDAGMAFEFAFENIKPGDVVNVGMHRGDNDNMVEDNVAMVEKILGE